jgi:hypothetical protein
LTTSSLAMATVHCCVNSVIFMPNLSVKLSVTLPVKGLKSSEKFWRATTNLAWFYYGF